MKTDGLYWWTTLLVCPAVLINVGTSASGQEAVRVYWASTNKITSVGRVPAEMKAPNRIETNHLEEVFYSFNTNNQYCVIQEKGATITRLSYSDPSVQGRSDNYRRGKVPTQIQNQDAMRRKATDVITKLRGHVGGGIQQLERSSPDRVFPPFEPSGAEWYFFWHRFIGTNWVWDEHVSVVIDDVTGLFSSYQNRIRDEEYVIDDRPVVPMEGIKQKSEAFAKKHAPRFVPPPDPGQFSVRYYSEPMLVAMSPQSMSADDFKKQPPPLFKAGKRVIRRAWLVRLLPMPFPLSEAQIKQTSPSSYMLLFWDAHTGELMEQP